TGSVLGVGSRTRWDGCDCSLAAALEMTSRAGNPLPDCRTLMYRSQARYGAHGCCSRPASTRRPTLSHLSRLTLIAVLLASAFGKPAVADSPPVALFTFGGLGSGPGQFDHPFGITIGP